jgi:SUMO ligase MMS21 Smc5/6 complex component
MQALRRFSSKVKKEILMVFFVDEKNTCPFVVTLHGKSLLERAVNHASEKINLIASKRGKQLLVYASEKKE